MTEKLKVEFIEEFKKNFHEKFGYSPIVLANESDEQLAPIMALDELENYFAPFFPKAYGKTLNFKSLDRRQELVDLRFIYAHLARTMGYSLTAIAKYTKKHHSSIIHHLRAFKNLMETSELFREKYKTILQNIKENHKPNDELSAMVYFDKVQHESKPVVLS
jgi:predicted transcriptional regulator